MKAIVAMMAFLLLAGCAVLETVEKSPMVAQITVQQATLRVIDEDVEKAVRVLEITRDVREMMSVDSVTLAVLDDFIRVQIRWEKLSLADEQLLRMLLTEMQDRLAEKFGQGLLTPEDKVSISKVIDWIEDSAQLVWQRRGA
jgi:hypothetical protein